MEVLALSFIGGSGSLLGGVFAAFLFIPVFNSLASLMQYKDVIYGLTLIVIMIFYPAGLNGLYQIVKPFFKILERKETIMKTANSFAYQSPQFSVLSESHLRDIHEAALEVLRRTGLRFHHKGALEMLKKAGAFISDGDLVKFPSHLVQEALASAPGRVIMCDREGKPTMPLEGNQVHFGTGSDCIYLLDPKTGQHRSFVEADLPDAYHLCDALPNIHFVMSVGIPSNVDGALTYDVQMAHMLEDTTKPIVFVTNDKASCQRAIDMAAAVAGGYEALREQQHILLYSEPSSPLQQSETAVDKLLLMAEYELPVVHSPGPQMGAVVPITMAGGLVLALAEILEQPGCAPVAAARRAVRLWRRYPPHGHELPCNLLCFS